MENAPIPFDPCSLEANEQISAKIWELLRRNQKFLNAVERLKSLDMKLIKSCVPGREFNTAAWEKSRNLLWGISKRHAFAGVALQWLIPEPLFHVACVAWPLGKKWKERKVFVPRVISVGEGTTPDIRDTKHWRWWKNSSQANHAGRLMTRGPDVHWTRSTVKNLRSKVNPIREWKEYKWPFTVAHSWEQAPAGFRREFEHLWRSNFDSRPFNPISDDRSDSPFPHETYLFHGWTLNEFSSASNLTLAAASKICRLNSLAEKYRFFAVPKTILTKQAANAVGEWLSIELKKGLKNDGELFGTSLEWRDWLATEKGLFPSFFRETHYYRRMRYMKDLSANIYPDFDVAALLCYPKHRERGKRYLPKGRQK